MTPGNTLVSLLQGGFGSLAAYLAAHVLLCLLPAFFVAGALSALVPKEAVTRFLGPRATKIVSYPAAALGGFVLAVCSCTILPLFAGIHKKGAGLGPAITFLFVGPAINIWPLVHGWPWGRTLPWPGWCSRGLWHRIALIMAVIFADDAPADGRGRRRERRVRQRGVLRGRVWLLLGCCWRPDSSDVAGPADRCTPHDPADFRRDACRPRWTAWCPTTPLAGRRASACRVLCSSACWPWSA